jgi:hypothetical protein
MVLNLTGCGVLLHRSTQVAIGCVELGLLGVWLWLALCCEVGHRALTLTCG